MTWKVTRQVVPVMSVAAVILADSAGPLVAGARLTIVWAGVTIPLGKPDPVRFTIVTPGWATPGEVGEVSVTAVGETVSARMIGTLPAPASRTIRISRRNMKSRRTNEFRIIGS